MNYYSHPLTEAQLQELDSPGGEIRGHTIHSFAKPFKSEIESLRSTLGTENIQRWVSCQGRMLPSQEDKDFLEKNQRMTEYISHLSKRMMKQAPMDWCQMDVWRCIGFARFH